MSNFTVEGTRQHFEVEVGRRQAAGLFMLVAEGRFGSLVCGPDPVRQAAVIFFVSVWLHTGVHYPFSALPESRVSRKL